MSCHTAFRMVLGEAAKNIWLIAVFVCCGISVSGQDANATHKTTRSTTPSRPIKRGSPQPAIVTMTVSPKDSLVQLDDRDISEKFRSTDGALNITMVPGIHTLIVRRLGYGDQQITLELNRGENEPISVVLKRLPGRLSVLSTPEGTHIEVRDSVNGETLVTSDISISNQDLTPGDYDIVASKSGYLVKSRRVSIAPGENTHVELVLEQEPKPEPTPEPKVEQTRRPSFLPDSTTQITISHEGKDVIVVLTGRSGKTENSVGTIDVIAGDASPVSGSINGMLPGFPCRVSLVRLENVTNDLSIVEGPGTANEWKRIVVRLRPKDSKRPMHFAINWSLLEQ